MRLLLERARNLNKLAFSLNIDPDAKFKISDLRGQVVCFEINHPVILEHRLKVVKV